MFRGEPHERTQNRHPAAPARASNSLKSELKELAAVHDDTIAVARDARVRCDAQVAEMAAELSVKGAKLARLQVGALQEGDHSQVRALQPAAADA